MNKKISLLYARGSFSLNIVGRASTSCSSFFYSFSISKFPAMPVSNHLLLGSHMHKNNKGMAPNLHKIKSCPCSVLCAHRIDKGVNMTLYLRAAAALRSLYKSPTPHGSLPAPLSQLSMGGEGYAAEGGADEDGGYNNGYNGDGYGGGRGGRGRGGRGGRGQPKRRRNDDEEVRTGCGCGCGCR